MNANTDIGARAEREVGEVEAFLQAWIGGSVDDSPATFARFGDVLAPGFHIIPPIGYDPLDRHGIIEYMLRQHGTDPATTRWVENARTGYVGNGVAVVVYEEWQVRDGERKGSIISAFFREASNTPNGVQWTHIHETTIP
jgi:hypothetical protein